MTTLADAATRRLTQAFKSAADRRTSVARDPPPFSKWDPDGNEASARAYARAVGSGADEDEARAAARAAMTGEDVGREGRAHPGKVWLLRWAWALAGGFMAFGYLIMIILLTGHGHWLGL